jgi:hypothetical protein
MMTHIEEDLMNETTVRAFEPQASPESVIMTRLAQSAPLTLDDLVEQVPQLTWNQVFRAVDGLTRSGAIIVRRNRFQYELSTVG